MNYKTFSLLIFVLMFGHSCNLEDDISEYEPVEKFSSELYIYDSELKTNRLLESGLSPVFNAGNDKIIYKFSCFNGICNYVDDQIITISLNGNNKEEITDYFSNIGKIIVSEWSNKIIFYANDFKNETWDLFILDDDGTNLTNLTHTVDLHEYEQSFSFDGSKICFVQTDRWASYYELGIMDLNGNKKIIYKSENERIKNPKFTLNDTKIVFSEEVRHADGEKTLKMIDVNDPSILYILNNLPATNLVTNQGKIVFYESYKKIKSYDLVSKTESFIGTGVALSTSWNEDKILYTDSNSKCSYLMMMNFDGSETDTLSADSLINNVYNFDYYPSFSHDDKMIVYSKEFWYYE